MSYIEMRQTMTISLPEELKEELDRLTALEGVSRSEIIRESLKDYLFQRRFRELRARMMATAQAKGVFTDEDVFNKIS